MKAAIKSVNNVVTAMMPVEDNASLPVGYDTLWDWNVWLAYLASITPQQALTKEEAHAKADEFQHQYFDQNAISFCINVKLTLISLGVNTATSLPFQMIEACSRWINKLWLQAETYVSSGATETDYLSTVGAPPCEFRDIRWILDANLQAIEPTRNVNTDINYYLNYN